ncbi:MAG: diguanylate cyclase, partial [Kovacikia sp.]
MTQQRNSRVLRNKQLKHKLRTEAGIQKLEKDQSSKNEANPHQISSQSISQILETAIITTDASGKILLLNTLAEKLTGWSFHDARSLPLSSVFKIVGKFNFKALEIPIGEFLCRNQNSFFSDDVLLVKSNKNLIPIEYSLSPIYDSNQIVGTALVFRDTSSLYRTNCPRSWQPDHDPLTGLISRSSFEDYLAQVLQDSKTLARTHILCYLDLDRFKIINEVCGHLAGDEFLRQFSAILQMRIRKTDILARLGGDEFGLILQHCNLEQALSVLQTLHEEVRKFRFSWQSHTFNFTFSAGITLLHPDSESGSNVLIEADSACTIAKGKGRDRVQVYQEDDQDVTSQRGDTRGVLRVIKALEEDQFLLYCQPIVPVAIADNSACQYYYEILIRLQDEQGRLIPPNEFLPAAERYGLMHLVDRWVIQNLFKTLTQSSTKAGGSVYKSLRKYCYSINLSGSSFNDDQFLEFVQEQFALYLVPPESICFE